LPSTTSRNSSRILSFAAWSACLPSGVARYTFRRDRPEASSVDRRYPFPSRAAQNRVHGSRADPVFVPRQLLDHAQSKNRLLAGVVQDVEADEAGVQVAVVVVRHSKRISHSLMERAKGANLAVSVGLARLPT
jgi:hypothetical protein